MIIGRKEEQAMLERAFKSKEAEFIAIYGCRRVGKTILIREFFIKKSLFFILPAHKSSLGLCHKLINTTNKNIFTSQVSKAYFFNY